MADERLHFADSVGGYNSMLAAEHLVRYHSVRQLCSGKRVLDVACGEGYGSALLAEWGASEVVGIDISADAIAAAEKVFGHRKIKFIEGNACRLKDVLGDVPPFDLIVSFETMEHVPDVSGLLAGIRHYQAAEGAVVISCPNDHVEDAINPYHLRRYTFDEFRSVTTAVLGSASGWLLGTPAQGEMIFPVGEPGMENSSDDRMLLATKCHELAQSAVIPAQPNIAPDSGSCRFFIGYWGVRLEIDAVMSPQSFSAFSEPYRALAWFRQERDALIPRHEELRIANAELERHLADLRRRMVVQARLAHERLEQAKMELAQMERLRAELVGLQHELAGLQQSRSYRLMQIYVRSYSVPVVGTMLRGLRRVARVAVRGIRTR